MPIFDEKNLCGTFFFYCLVLLDLLFIKATRLKHLKNQLQPGVPGAVPAMPAVTAAVVNGAAVAVPVVCVQGAVQKLRREVIPVRGNIQHRVSAEGNAKR